MIQIARNKRPSFILLVILFGLVLLGMFYFGIRLKGFRSGNHAIWANPPPGLVFNHYAMAYTDGFFRPNTSGGAPGGLTIELALQPWFPRDSHFMYLVLINDGDDQRQLVIGQWRTSLIIMHGNDHSNKRRLPKIYAPLDQDQHSHLVTIVSDGSGTKIFFDGKLKKRNKHLTLRYPDRVAQARLVVGNSLAGNRPWGGKIMGLTMYDHEMDAEVVRRHFHQWHNSHTFDAFRPDAPRLLYTFDEGRGDVVHNKVAAGPDLMVPDYVKVLQKKVLTWPSLEGVPSESMEGDIIVNIIGFVPLGVLLFAIMGRIEGSGDRINLLVTVTFAFLFSLSIEIIQIWIPSRVSSLLDLILNILGSCLGVLLFKVVAKRVQWL